MSKRLFFLILFGILIFGFRLTMLNEAIYDDESNFAYSLTVMDEFGFNEDYYSPQPLNLLYKPFIFFFGLETWVFRLIPWLFGIINTVFVYILAKRHWNEKVAYWAAFLMLVSFYPTLASLQFDVEGNLVMFCVILMIYSYLEYEKSISPRRKLAWQILTGIGLAIAVISKYNNIYLVLILALYSLIKSKWNLKSSFKDLFMIYLVGFILFLCYVLLGMLTSPDHWLNFIWVIGFNRYYSSLISLQAIPILLLWSTPLLFGFYLLAWRFKDPKNLIFLIWITVPVIFYTLLIKNGSHDRYFMLTIPAFVILGGYFLSKIQFTKQWIILSTILFSISFGLFTFLSTIPFKYVARFPSVYLEELKNLNLNFLFSYTSASGPTFGINFTVLFVAFILSFFSLVIYLLLAKRKFFQFFLICFFSIALAFNIFLVSEYFLHNTGPDVSHIKWEMINYVKEGNLSFPIYTNDQGIQWYFENTYWHRDIDTRGFSDNELEDNSLYTLNRIRTEQGTLVLLRWPPLHDQSPALVVVKECHLLRQFYDKKILIGEVYQCVKRED